MGESEFLLSGQNRAGNNNSNFSCGLSIYKVRFKNIKLERGALQSVVGEDRWEQRDGAGELWRRAKARAGASGGINILITL